MPLDQSIVFDGGWRIISGQIPFRDFTTPVGIIPIVIQAAFFKLFGISWFSYCLHAAVVNGVFCILVYMILRTLEASRTLAVTYAALSGMIMYPPMGTPYPDQHAFFFITLLIYFLIKGVKTRNTFHSLLNISMVPFVLLVAFFSKQNPTIFAVPLILFIVVFLVPMYKKTSFFKVIAGLVLSLLICLYLLMSIKSVFNIDMDKFNTYFIELPRRISYARFYDFNLLVFVQKYYESLLELGCISPFIIHIVFVFSLFLVVIRTDRIINLDVYQFFLVTLSISLIIISNIFCYSTNNQVENCFALLFISMGILHIYLKSYLSVYGKKWTQWSTCILVLALAFDLFHVGYDINYKRAVHDLSYQSSLSEKPETPALKFMNYQVPDHYEITAGDLDEIVEYLKAKEGNFLLIGDYSILYALTGKPSVHPSLWFHYDLTIPRFDTVQYLDYKEDVLKSMNRYKIKYIVFEKKGTYLQFKIDQFDFLSKVIMMNYHKQFAFGGFEVIELKREYR